MTVAVGVDCVLDVVTVDTAMGCTLARIRESAGVERTGCTMALWIGRLLVVGVVIGLMLAVFTASVLVLQGDYQITIAAFSIYW
jgi:hypothetical protein